MLPGHQWPRWESNPQNHQALDLVALPDCVLDRKWRVVGLNHSFQAYETQMGTGPPAL